MDVRGWSKGLLFVNGVNLGWYWPTVGPQGAQYVPGPFLKPGQNEVILVEVVAAPKAQSGNPPSIPILLSISNRRKSNWKRLAQSAIGSLCIVMVQGCAYTFMQSYYTCLLHMVVCGPIPASLIASSLIWFFNSEVMPM